MGVNESHWELIILDGHKYAAWDGRLVDLLCADLDNDGKSEILTTSTWYRMATGERGVLAQRVKFDNVQPAAGDLDGDGRLEIVCSAPNPAREGNWPIYWYKLPRDLSAPWREYVLSPDHTAHPHDILITDIDGDGQNEVIAVGVYGEVTQGLYAYRPGDDITQPWRRHTLMTGLFADGTAAADLNGNGVMEIVSGPVLYAAPGGGPYSGTWRAYDLAPGFRQLCRALAVDITGDGQRDVVLIEAEYPDCRLSWFENRMRQDPDRPWIEHPIAAAFAASHTLDTWQDEQGRTHLLVAESENGTGALYNHDARILQFTTGDGGQTWRSTEIYRGQGTWMAQARDVDDDGQIEILGGTDCGFGCAGVHVWKARDPSFPVRFRHRFIDREKPLPSTDILAVDVNANGREDIVCGAWWYENPGTASSRWERREIPGIYQAICACDVDGDGRKELVGTRRLASQDRSDWRAALSGELCWLKPIRPSEGVWNEHRIGTATTGSKGSAETRAVYVPDLFGDGGAGLIAQHTGPIELYRVPADPAQDGWPRRALPEAQGCAPEMIPYDLTGNGRSDLIGCWQWLENLGDGSFRAHPIAPRLDPQTQPDGWRRTAQALLDVNGNGHVDLVACEETDLGTPYTKEGKFSRLAWFEQPDDPRSGPWRMHVIDHICSPNSLVTYDLDGDGEAEIVVGEHDPRIDIYYGRKRLFVYKRADVQGLSWTRHVIEDRFDHYRGGKLIRLGDDKVGIVSQGLRGQHPAHWLSRDSRWVHLWEPV